MDRVDGSCGRARHEVAFTSAVVPISEEFVRKLLFGSYGCGVGDWFFLQKLFHVLKSNDFSLLHVASANLIRANVLTMGNSTVKWIGRDSSEVVQGVEIVDFSRYVLNHPFDIMTSKYNHFGVDWKGWQSYFSPTRNKTAEISLRRRLVQDGQPYIVRCRDYSFTKSHRSLFSVPQDYDGLVIDLDFRLTPSGIFEWCGILEGAEQIHIVDSVWMYLTEVCECRASAFYAHPRSPLVEKCVAKLFRVPWRFVTYPRRSDYPE